MLIRFSPSVLMLCENSDADHNWSASVLFDLSQLIPL